MKKGFIILLSVILLVGMAQFAFADENSVSSGVCGENISWTLDDEGVLTISGSGKMYDYGGELAVGDVPWEEQRKTIRKILIDPRVTYIGAGAFEKTMLLTELVLPEGVEEIGESAFNRCVNLEKVTFPDSLIRIGDFAFSGCETLKSVSVGSGIESIGRWAFMDCKKLKDVYIKDLKKWLKVSYEDGRSNPMTYGANLYVNGELLTDLVITSDMCPIGTCAMEGCGSLRSVTYPSDVADIGGDYIFMWCPNLSTVIVPDNITSLGWCAFDGCHSLEKIVLGRGIEEIHQFTFNGVYNASIFFTGTEEEWKCIYKSADNGCIKTAPVHFGTTEHTPETKSWFVQQATCVSQGEYCEQTSCTVCGKVYLEEKTIIPATGHNYVVDIVLPTCFERGYTTYSCECGDSYVADYVNSPGHQYVSEVITPATHTQAGIIAYTCVCGDTYTKEIEKKTEHEFIPIVTEPTCKEHGYTTYVCECGESYTRDYVSVTAHSDADDDSICDFCGEPLCDHACHKTGVTGFFWKIICFFSKLFGSNKFCECGVAHY